MNKNTLHNSFIKATALCLLLASVASCNKKDKDETEEVTVTTSTVAIKSFSLQRDEKVLSRLDSVFFSIDLSRGVVFNADSLPKDTDVRKLIPVITFMGELSKAELAFTNPDGEAATVDYLTTKTDSIDFSSPVTLNVTALDGKTQYTYTLKVNVHKQKPDSLMWSSLAVAKLPSRLGNPKRQKTVGFKKGVLSLIEENNGTFTVSESTDLYNGIWEKEAVSFPFTPETVTLTSAGGHLFMLDSTGMLHESEDGKSWTPTGEVWAGITGPYLNSVLGIKADSKGLTHCHWPADGLIEDTPVDPSFPLSGRSALVSVTSEWSPQPTAFFIGGRKSDGTLSAATWAFDGSGWTVIDSGTAPALAGPSVVAYYNYRNQSDIFNQLEATAWLAIGGLKEDGTGSDTVWLSYDNGVTWQPGTELMRLPVGFPELESADALTMASPNTKPLSGYWTNLETRKAGPWYKPAVEIEGTDISWECPYIYYIGGYASDGILSDTIWKGWLARLLFTPLF